MIHVVYKYPLEITDAQHLQFPVGAKVLRIDMQGHRPCAWVLHPHTGKTVAEQVEAPPESELVRETWEIRMVGTGHFFEPEGWDYISTFFVDAFVFHTFARKL